MSKGKRREGEAKKLYQESGLKVETPVETKWDHNTDYFNLFDGMATDGSRLTFYQVKSNRAGGIVEWQERAAEVLPCSVHRHFLVCHDYEGWRLAVVDGDGYEWVVDEREMSCGMGDGVSAFLRGEIYEQVA